jgi:hypothetical protein
VKAQGGRSAIYHDNGRLEFHRPTGAYN